MFSRFICIEGKPCRGQPKLSITFRGQGKKISAEERTGWHPDVHVRFQKKVWADDALCEEVADRALRIACDLWIFPNVESVRVAMCMLETGLAGS